MELKEITDSVSIFKMIETLFMQFPVYILLNGKPIQVKIIAIKNQRVLIHCPNEFQDLSDLSLLLTNAGNLLVFKFKVITKDPRGVNVLSPFYLTIQVAKRTNNRYQASVIPLHISNTISQSMVAQDLSDSPLKLERIIKPYTHKLETKFTQAIFCLSERLDPRARLLTETERNLFIPDINSPESVSDEFISYNEYFQMAKPGKNNNKFQSEICVPLKYKDTISFGYLQVLNLKKMDINDYNIILHVASRVSKELIHSDIFSESKVISNILDISTTGLSFSHNQSKDFGKIFSIGGTVLFDLYEEEKRVGTFKAVIRNIFPQEKHFRIGCQFFYFQEEYKVIDALIKKYFPEGQESVNAKQTKSEAPPAVDLELIKIENSNILQDTEPMDTEEFESLIEDKIIK